jgi:hypothetical protein
LLKYKSNLISVGKEIEDSERNKTMKRYGNLYHKIYNLENIRLAHKNARRGKSHYSEVKMVDTNPEKYFMKTLPIFTAIFFLLTSTAFAIQGSSDTQPADFVGSRGLTQVNYNVQEVNGTWTYDYVEVEGSVTAAKVLEALSKEGLETDAVEWTPDEIATQYEDSRAALALSNIADMSYAELDDYIDDNVTNLAEAKQYLKKISKAVLAMIKQWNYE